MKAASFKGKELIIGDIYAHALKAFLSQVCLPRPSWLALEAARMGPLYRRIWVTQMEANIHITYAYHISPAFATVTSANAIGWQHGVVDQQLEANCGKVRISDTTPTKRQANVKGTSYHHVNNSQTTPDLRIPLQQFQKAFCM